jgi:hypothetical protein
LGFRIPTGRKSAGKCIRSAKSQGQSIFWIFFEQHLDCCFTVIGHFKDQPDFIFAIVLLEKLALTGSSRLFAGEKSRQRRARMYFAMLSSEKVLNQSLTVAPPFFRKSLFCSAKEPDGGALNWLGCKTRMAGTKPGHHEK